VTIGGRVNARAAAAAAAALQHAMLSSEHTRNRQLARDFLLYQQVRVDGWASHTVPEA